MYCDIPQVNILTSLLIAHGIRHVVVCPGSRNATILHNLHEAGTAHFTLHPVTDERSAAFVALGITTALREPAAVCVTSGSALLGCIPAVAEAHYRRLPLLIISADRPQAWIGQGDGQTLEQQGALMPYAPTFQVSQPHTPEQHWLCNRRINEAMAHLMGSLAPRPAHINVSISEPMFSFTTPQLPRERVIHYVTPPQAENPLPPDVLQLILQAPLPLLIIGHNDLLDLRAEVTALQQQGSMLVLPELIADVPGNHLLEAFDQVTATGGANILFQNKQSSSVADHSSEKLSPVRLAPAPLVAVQVGGNFVHKHFKQWLRQCEPLSVVRLGPGEEAPHHLPDTFCHLTHYVQCSPAAALKQIARALGSHPHRQTHVRAASEELETTYRTLQAQWHKENEGRLTFHTTLESLRAALQAQSQPYTLHLANSTAVRAAGHVFQSGTFPIMCNRGVNGIEGSLSTAVGHALVMWGLTICVIGDLSFFYDLTALYNVQLPANLRVLLYNNGHGAIFDHLPGLSASPAAPSLVAAAHPYTAEGVASTFHLHYQRVTSPQQLPQAMRTFLAPSNKAQLLECGASPTNNY